MTQTESRRTTVWKSVLLNPLSHSVSFDPLPHTAQIKHEPNKKHYRKSLFCHKSVSTPNLPRHQEKEYAPSLLSSAQTSPRGFVWTIKHSFRKTWLNEKPEVEISNPFLDDLPPHVYDYYDDQQEEHWIRLPLEQYKFISYEYMYKPISVSAHSIKAHLTLEHIL
jgi:hypothetical protein